MKFSAASLKESRWPRRIAIAVLVVLGFWLLAWIAVPPIARSQLQKIATEKLGRQVTVEQVEFKPWSLELAVLGLRVATADGGGSQLSVARVYVDAELQSLLRLAPVIDAISIESPSVLLTHQADGKYDIDDVIARLAPPAAKPESGEPPRFAIYNIRIAGGSVDFDDRTVKRRHELRDFTLDVPFLSNLPSQREVKVAPKLAFVLNGSRFDSSGSSTPFATSRKTDVALEFKALDLAPYVGYLPRGLPVALQAGTLDAALKIDFEQAQTAGLRISGTVGASGVQLVDAAGRDLLRFDGLQLGLTDVRPLDRSVQLGELALTAPRLVIARDEKGGFDLVPVAAPGVPPAAAPSAPTPPEATTPPPPKAWQIQLDKLAITGGEIGWRDRSTQPVASVDLRDLAVQASAIAWPMQKPARFAGSATLGGAAFKFAGQGTDAAAQVDAELAGLPLSVAAPYLAQRLVPGLDGKLSAQLALDWARPALRIKGRRVALDGLALTQDKASLASVDRFELRDVEADLAKRSLSVGTLGATRPKLQVSRGQDKRWMFERWLRPADAQAAPDAASAKPAVDTATPTGSAPPWTLSVGQLAVDEGAISFADQAAPTPVEFEISALKVSAQSLVPGSAAASPLRVSGRIAAGRSEAGRFDYQGTVALQPVAAEGRLELAAVPAHAFKAYYAEALNIDIRRAFANYRGTVKFAALPAGPSLRLAGDTALDDFRANSAALTQAAPAAVDASAPAPAPTLGSRGNQILRWKTLSLRNLQLELKPGAALAVDVRETTLTDFFARVIVDPSGRLNLQDLTRRPGGTVAAPPPADAEPRTRRGPGGSTTTTAPVPQPAGAAGAEARGPAPVVEFGPMNLVNGRIDFTDLFVKPNYSADLSELNGKLSAFSSRPQSDKPALAELELRGKAQQTAPLEITGKLNPLAKPLELDVTARMRDLDLPPLSPYSVRYAGHGIERGKLSMDVSYRISPDGQLTATNKLVLNQLRFGEAVEGAPNSLPVRLAVALLADRNGVIDVDFPISGSLNDPQFSIGPLIFKAFLNLIAKAVTSPFSLLTGGLGGGGGESSVITFPAGSATLTAEARDSLDKVAKALAERPALQMTVVGTANLEKEREAYQRERLRQLAQAEKRRAAVRANQNAADVAPMTEDEYPELLEAIYKRADIGGKPRNVVGLTKQIPTADMEKLLLPSIAVDEELIRQLAVARGAAVRDYLLAQQLPGDRLFLGAVRTRAEGADWKPGAELDLATR